MSAQHDEGTHKWIETGRSPWANYTFECPKCGSYSVTSVYVAPPLAGCKPKKQVEPVEVSP